MEDLIQLMPHCKKDNKLDTKNDRGIINEVADMKVRRCAALPACLLVGGHKQTSLMHAVY
jgi:hypothetical protein